MGDRTNGQDQRSECEYVHWFRWRVESLCPGIKEFRCLVDERPLDLDVPGAGDENPATCLGVAGDIRDCNVSVIGDEDVVLFGQIQ